MTDVSFYDITARPGPATLYALIATGVMQHAHGNPHPFAEVFLTDGVSCAESIRFVHPLSNASLSHDELTHDAFTTWVMGNANSLLSKWATDNGTTTAVSRWDVGALDLARSALLVKRRFEGVLLDLMRTDSRNATLKAFAGTVSSLAIPKQEPI